jgi:hypothetical protein
LNALTNRRGRLTWVECVAASDICFHPSLMSFEFPRYGLPPRVTHVDDRCPFWIRQTILLLSFFLFLFSPLTSISMSSTLERSKWAFKLLFFFFIKFGYHSFDCCFYRSFFFLSTSSFNIWFVRKLDSLIFYAPSIW